MFVTSVMLAVPALPAVDVSLTPLAGASTDGQSTAAAFAAFLTLDNNQTYQTAASSGANAVAWGRINPDPKHAGKLADLFVLVKIEGIFYMRTPTGAFLPWLGGFGNLVPVRRDVPLGSSIGVDIFSGKLGLSGVIEIYLGYKLKDSAAIIFSPTPQSFAIVATSSPVLTPTVPTASQARSAYPATTKLLAPAWQQVSINGSYVNDDSVIGLSSNSVSDDGNRIVFSTWSSNGMGLATRNCSFDWLYVRDIEKKTLSIAAYDFTGKILCGYESIAGISGNGKYLFYRGIQKPYSFSTTSMSGIWRTEIGTRGYIPVNAKGLEFSFEQNGSLNYGTVLKGDAQRYMPDRDGNSVAFSMKYLENVSDVGRQYNATLFAHAILRQDKGAQTVGNQDYSLAHGMTNGTGDYLYFDVSNNGTVIVYNEIIASKTRFRAWDMLTRQDLGMLFNDEVIKEPNVNPAVCGVSVDGRYVLVKHSYSLPLDPASPTTSYTKFGGQGRLSRYDRIKKEFVFVAVSEEESRSMEATCDYFHNDTNPRQLSADGNRVFWNTGGYFWIRDIANQKTIKIKQNATVYAWAISADGRFIVYMSGTAPDGTVFKNSYGSNMSQIYRYGPIEAADFGASFSLHSFEEKLVAK